VFVRATPARVEETAMGHDTGPRETASPQRAARLRAVATTKPRRAAAAAPSPLVALQQSIGNRAVGRLVQAKLKVGRPSDRFEREADRVADQVLRLPYGAAPAAIVDAAAAGNGAQAGRDSEGRGALGDADARGALPMPAPRCARR
jgi:hypothetical protein